MLHVGDRVKVRGHSLVGFDADLRIGVVKEIKESCVIVTVITACREEPLHLPARGLSNRRMCDSLSPGMRHKAA